MRNEDNLGPENGSQDTAVSSQQSENTDSRPRPTRKSPTEPDGHECPINRNSRAKCRAWEAGGLSPALRCFAGHHSWHGPGIYTNKRILRRVFAKPIAKAVGAFTCDGKTTIATQIQTDFARLQETTRSLDRMCIRRIDEDDEEVVFEHIKGQLSKMLHELAELLESVQQNQECRMENEEKPAETREIVDIPPAKTLRPDPSPLRGTGPLQGESEEWVTCKEAGEMVGRHPATIGRWVREGKVRDNGQTNQKRRILKTDILLIKQGIEEKDAQTDEDEVERDKRKMDREL